MGQQFNEVINTNALRFEDLKLPDGNKYSMGATMAELQAIYTALGGDITAVNNIVTQLRNNERLVAASLNELNSRIERLEQLSNGS